ncbi:MAG: branched-chain amino acid ABC transporter permease [Chloroflexi bacterium]|nr:branched-chain amino acid ABC transporter permease [Chloroflexota bacterium]MYC47139.1 branched-chain amino acid ABC transporter permease [Chloroflexota bacterium]
MLAAILRVLASPAARRLSRAAQLVAAIAFGAAAASQIDLAVNGMFLGSILALGAIGITLIYGVLRFANIAQGDMMTFGAYLAFFLLVSVLPEHAGLGPFTFGFPLLLAIPISMAGVAALAVGMEILVFRRLRLRRANLVTIEIASLGLAIAVRGVVQMIWDTPVRYYPHEGRDHFSLPAGVSIAPNHLFVAGAALLLAIGLHLLLTRTKSGKAMRATSDNPDLARASGIDTDRVLLWTWAIGGLLAGAAGVLLVIFNATSQLKPTIGFQLLVPLFAAVVVGGIGNPYGAFLGAMLIGISMEVSTAWALPTYKPAIAFLVMVLVLLFRPHGLLGARD